MESLTSDAQRFDQRGYLVRHLFGREKRQVFIIPGTVKTRTWRFADGAAIQTQSLTDAHEWLDQYLEKYKSRLEKGRLQHGAH
jgi:hypothetical protein